MQEKPLVLVFTTAYKPFIGGAELAIAEITTRLKDKHEFIIITAQLSRALRKNKVEQVSEGTIIRLGVGISAVDKLLLPFLGFFTARKIIKTRKTILLWGVMISYASISAYFIKIFYKHIPFVLTIQEGNREWEKFSSSLFWKIIPKKANHITSISNFLAERAREKGYDGKISIVPNGVDEKLLTLLTKRSDRQMADGPQIIFSASRLVYKNGIDILLNAVAKLKDEFNFKIILAGDGSERKNLELIADNLSLADHVQFLGSVPYEKLPEYYVASDIFVRPSRTEGLGSAFLEAMASGLITIGTAVGGIPDFLEDGKTGFLAKPEDAENLADVLRKVLELSEEDKNDIIKNAKSEIESRFLWINIAKQMDNIFLSELEYDK